MRSPAKLCDYTPKFAYVRNLEQRVELLSGKKIELVPMVMGSVVEAESPSQRFCKSASLQSWVGLEVKSEMLCVQYCSHETDYAKEHVRVLDM